MVEEEKKSEARFGVFHSFEKRLLKLPYSILRANFIVSRFNRYFGRFHISFSIQAVGE